MAFLDRRYPVLVGGLWSLGLQLLGNTVVDCFVRPAGLRMHRLRKVP